MDLIQEGRHFRLVPESELPEVLRILDGYLPESLKLHQTVKTYINNRIWDFHFYVSKEWPKKPVIIHFPGCTLSPDNNIYQSLSIFCPISHLELIDLVATEDVLINWKKPMYLHFTHTALVDRLNDFYKNIGTMQQYICDVLILNDLNVDLEVEDFLNDEAEIRPLCVNDIKLIHQLYPAKDVESIELFEILVNKLPALGVFIKESNNLAAWLVCSYYGAMFSMQTLPKYRRKGYGSRIAKSLTKRIIEFNYVPYVTVLPHNVASKNLYLKLGFENSYQLHQTIKTYINNRIWDFHFYVSKEWPKKPVINYFPGCTLSPDNNIYQSLSIFCPVSHLELIDLVATEDVLINWKKPMYLHFTHTALVDRLNDFYKNIGTMQQYICFDDLNVDLEVEDFLNDEAEIRPLCVNDIKLIHQLYPAKDVESIELFETLVNKLPALGVFIKESNDLAAWLVCSYYGAMFSMQTLPKYRRKGYGSQIAKALTKRIIDFNYVPYVTVLPHNAASKNLYLKLGFQNSYQMSRVKMTPYPSAK